MGVMTQGSWSRQVSAGQEGVGDHCTGVPGGPPPQSAGGPGPGLQRPRRTPTLGPPERVREPSLSRYKAGRDRVCLKRVTREAHHGPSLGARPWRRLPCARQPAGPLGPGEEAPRAGGSTRGGSAAGDGEGVPVGLRAALAGVCGPDVTPPAQPTPGSSVSLRGIQSLARRKDGFRPQPGRAVTQSPQLAEGRQARRELPLHPRPGSSALCWPLPSRGGCTRWPRPGGLAAPSPSARRVRSAGTLGSGAGGAGISPCTSWLWTAAPSVLSQASAECHSARARAAVHRRLSSAASSGPAARGAAAAMEVQEQTS